MVDEDYFPPGQAARGYSRDRFRTTARHRDLIASLPDGRGSWAQTTLRTCLDHLTDSPVTEAWRVGVVDAWTESEDVFCVVYRWGAHSRTLGLRVAKADFSPGMFTDDPREIGAEIADYCIGEPLGTVAEHLAHDPTAHVWWWGSSADPGPP